MTTLTYARLAFGAMLIVTLFVPFGIFHTMAEPYVSGALWGFMLPVGYIAAASGAALILYPRFSVLKKLGFGYLLLVIGASMLLSMLLFPRELSISLLYGTNMIDTDYSTLSGAVVWLSIASIAAGAAFRAMGFDRRLSKK
jgi:hypothetical protein